MINDGHSKRGLVIYAPTAVSGHTISVDPNLDSQELRSSLLFWDVLEYPDNYLISTGATPDVEFLQSVGVLQRTKISMPPNRKAGDAIHGAVLLAYRTLDDAEPGVWSLGAGKNSVSLHESELMPGRGLLFSLYDAIPVPEKEVPLADILDFRQKRRDELLSLRYHLESIYQRILSSPDAALAVQSEITELERSIEGYIKVFKERSWLSVKATFDVSLNLPAAILGGYTAYSANLGKVGMLLGAAAGLKVGPGVGLKRRTSDDTLPFRYITSYRKWL